MKLAPIFALALATSPALAHAEDNAIAPGNTALTVSAQGHSTRVPDIATFSAGVVTQGRSASAALAANAQKMTAVIAALKAAGIADRDIQTSNLSISPRYADTNSSAPPPVVGYEASNQVEVKQRKVAEFGKVIDALVAAGANQVNGPTFSLDDGDAAADEARIDAMKRARARADLLARAAGLHVVRIVSIADGGDTGVRPPMPVGIMMRAMAKPETPVAAGEVDTGASVTVVFELGH